MGHQVAAGFQHRALRKGHFYNDVVTFRDQIMANLVPCEDHAFGKWVSKAKEHGLQKSRLHLTIAGDDAIFWISDRRGRVIQMDREELLELLTLLNQRMPLDALGSI